MPMGRQRYGVDPDASAMVWTLGIGGAALITGVVRETAMLTAGKSITR